LLYGRRERRTETSIFQLGFGLLKGQMTDLSQPGDRITMQVTAVPVEQVGMGVHDQRIMLLRAPVAPAAQQV